MEERPDRLVAKTLIEMFEILFREEDRAAVVFRKCFGFDPITDFLPDATSRPTYPYIFRGLR
jgi:hypothetical protein